MDISETVSSRVGSSSKRHLVHVTESPFHVFDRYWFHIHDSEEFCTGIFIISRSPSLPKLIKVRFPESEISAATAICVGGDSFCTNIFSVSYKNLLWSEFIITCSILIV